MERTRPTRPKNIKAAFAKELSPPTGQDPKTWYKEYIGKFASGENYNLDSLPDMSLLLFELMETTLDCYLDEKALYVSFILNAFQNS